MWFKVRYGFFVKTHQNYCIINYCNNSYFLFNYNRFLIVKQILISLRVKAEQTNKRRQE